MVKMAEPYKHPETGVYYLRRQIPHAIRSEFGGKLLWKRSLETKNPADARRLFTIANADLEARFAEARTAVDKRMERDLLSRSAATLIVDRAVKAEGGRFPILTNLFWSEDVAAQMVGGVTPMFTQDTPAQIERQRECPSLPGELFLKVVGTCPRLDAIRMANYIIVLVRGLMELNHDAYPEVARTKVNDGVLLDAISDRIRRELVELQEALRVPVRPATSRRRPDMRLVELFDAWKAKRKPDAKSAHETETTVKDFIAFAGDLPVRTIDVDLVYDFRDAVASLPKAMPKSDRDLPFNARVAKYEGHEDVGISPASVKKRIGHLQAMIGLAFKERWIDANPAAGIAIEGYSKTNSRRRPFRDGELGKLFRAPLFSKPADWNYSRSTVTDVTLAWSFLLGLSNGARLEEIGQTELASIKRDGTVRYIDLGIDAHVKTEASRRTIPIHRHVIECGFEDYLGALKAAGAIRLFPDLKPNGFDRLCHDASRLANRVIDREVGNDPTIVFHSLRHTFKDLGRDANVQAYVLDQIMGHAGVTAGDKYGIGARLTSLSHELERIRFQMIDWRTIKTAFGAVDWTDVAARLMNRMAT